MFSGMDGERERQWFKILDVEPITVIFSPASSGHSISQIVNQPRITDLIDLVINSERNKESNRNRKKYSNKMLNRFSQSSLRLSSSLPPAIFRSYVTTAKATTTEPTLTAGEKSIRDVLVKELSGANVQVQDVSGIILSISTLQIHRY